MTAPRSARRPAAADVCQADDCLRDANRIYDDGLVLCKKHRDLYYWVLEHRVDPWLERRTHAQAS